MTGSVSHYLGVLAAALRSFDDADRRFAAGARGHLRVGAPTWLARTSHEWARMLLVRRHTGDVENARGLLTQALATTRQFGLASLEHDIRGLLQELRSRN
jgi:hypothetical protein